MSELNKYFENNKFVLMKKSWYDKIIPIEDDLFEIELKKWKEKKMIE